MPNRVTHFELPSDRPEQAMNFYSEVFGWTFQQFSDQPYWLAISGDETTPGINGAIMKPVERGQPACNTITVEHIDDTLRKITAHGGKIIKPKWAIPTVGWLAFAADPDGNMHGIMEMDTNAG